jgi:hypothetical protein
VGARPVPPTPPPGNRDARPIDEHGSDTWQGEDVQVAENVHVVPDLGGWAVKRADPTRVSFVYPLEDDAINAARELAHRDRVELIIEGEHGQVRLRESYRDPNSPRR